MQHRAAIDAQGQRRRLQGAVEPMGVAIDAHAGLARPDPAADRKGIIGGNELQIDRRQVDLLAVDIGQGQRTLLDHHTADRARHAEAGFGGHDRLGSAVRRRAGRRNGGGNGSALGRQRRQGFEMDVGARQHQRFRLELAAQQRP